MNQWFATIPAGSAEQSRLFSYHVSDHFLLFQQATMTTVEEEEVVAPTAAEEAAVATIAIDASQPTRCSLCIYLSEHIMVTDPQAAFWNLCSEEIKHNGSWDLGIVDYIWVTCFFLSVATFRFLSHPDGW